MPLFAPAPSHKVKSKPLKLIPIALRGLHDL
jgi:hypothetical protein